MHRKYLVRFAVLTLLLFTLSAAVAQDEIVIDWWHIGTPEWDTNYWQTLADAYVTEHPNVVIEITILENNAFKERLLTVMQANDPPDLFHTWGGGVLWTFAEGGLVRNIAPELEGEWKDSFSAQAAVEVMGQNGEYYGVPWEWGAVGMFYNKALFELAGLDPDNPPETWAKFLEVVKTLKAAGITPIALGESEKWTGMYWWSYLVLRVGGQDAFLNAYNRTGSFADEAFLTATQHLEELIALDPFPENFLGLNYPDQAAIMGNGQAAMELMGQWSEGFQAFSSVTGEGIGDDLGWFPFPMVEGGVGNPDDVMGGGGGFAVGINAPNETVDFLRFLTSIDAQAAAVENFFPVVKGLEDAYPEDSVKATIVQARDNAPYYQLYLDQFVPTAMGEVIHDSTETLFAGVAPSEEVVNSIEEAAEFELDN